VGHSAIAYFCTYNTYTSSFICMYTEYCTEWHSHTHTHALALPQTSPSLGFLYVQFKLSECTFYVANCHSSIHIGAASSQSVYGMSWFVNLTRHQIRSSVDRSSVLSHAFDVDAVGSIQHTNMCTLCTCYRCRVYTARCHNDCVWQVTEGTRVTPT
jgi:hypothetical protein